MKVDEMLIKLKSTIEGIKEKYCENCQEWDCDECSYDMEESDV